MSEKLIMKNKEKVTISINSDLLKQIDNKIDKKNFKNRSHVIESLVLEWLKLKQDYGAVLLAHENNWNRSEYPLNYPKVLIQVEWKTLLEKHVEGLIKANVKDIVVTVSDETREVKNFLEKKWYDLNIHYLECFSWDESQKAIIEASKLLDVNKLLVILWDNYFYDLNLLDFMHYHNVNDNAVSIIVKMMDCSAEYGNIKLEWNNIVKFVERPESKEDISFIVNAWIYIIQRSSLWENYKNVKIEKDLFPRLVGNKNMKAYFHNGQWFHIQSDEVLKLFQ